MKKYFILNWFSQIAIIAGAFYIMAVVAGSIEPEIVPILSVAVVFGTLTMIVSVLTLSLWMKREQVFFIDRHTETNKTDSL